MKRLNLVLVCFGLILISNSIHAQFLEKLKERAKAATEEAILRKTEQEIEKKAEKTIDDILSPKRGDEKNNNRSSNTNDSNDERTEENILEDYLNQQEEIVLPESFSFEWKYVLQMESEAYKKKKKELGNSKITYFLSTQSSAYATQFELGKNKKGIGHTLMIMDPSTGVNVTLMEMDGNKIIQKMPSVAEIPSEENTSLDNAVIKKIGTKSIMGYTCQGFKVIMQGGVSTVYFYPNAPVSFINGGDPKIALKGLNAKWAKELENGLMMEMTFVSTENPKHNMKMSCVELVRQPLTVNINEYKSFMELDDNRN